MSTASPIAALHWDAYDLVPSWRTDGDWEPGEASWLRYAEGSEGKHPVIETTAEMTAKIRGLFSRYVGHGNVSRKGEIGLEITIAEAVANILRYGCGDMPFDRENSGIGVHAAVDRLTHESLEHLRLRMEFFDRGPMPSSSVEEYKQMSQDEAEGEAAALRNHGRGFLMMTDFAGFDIGFHRCVDLRQKFFRVTLLVPAKSLAVSM